MNPSLARSIGALLLSLAALAPIARAQGFDTPPQPGAPRPLTVRAPVEQRLPNGLRVVLAERRGVQLVTAQLVVLSGSEVDPPQRAGLASMTAGLLTKGTRRHGATALAQAAESLGGALDSGAGWHQSEVAITVTVPKLDAALGLVSEVVQQPVFAPAELDRLRAQALDELKVAYTQPATLAGLAAQRLLFGSGAYGHPAGGTPASLARIARADLLALHAARYRPDNAVLVLAGDLHAADALRLAQRHFGAWKARGSAAAPAPLPVGAALAQSTAVIDLPASGQAAVVVAAALPPLGADRATAAVMNAVLGGGYSSRLNQEIRIRRGLSYGAGSALDAFADGGSLRAVVQTKNESAAEVLGLVQSELDRLAAAPVGADELAARKATLIGDFSRSVETTAGLGAAVKALIVAGRPLAELGLRIDALSAVGADAVQRYAAAQLGTNGRRVVVAGDAARFAQALKATTPGLSVIASDKLDLDLGSALSAP
ncbi:MAG TPA: pitrilysin family protein [Burkholderiaceae bacterium]|nr:pitrilysin family protein [Burkholderiaceae bacterium]